MVPPAEFEVGPLPSDQPGRDGRFTDKRVSKKPARFTEGQKRDCLPPTSSKNPQKLGKGR